VTTAAEIVRAYPGARDVGHAVVALGRRLGVDPAWIANVIQFESRWNPQAVNRFSGASGLIQFMPSTAKGLGTTVEEIRRMTAAQQWQYVTAYFSRFAGRLRSQQDVFMAVFYPAAIGKPDYRFSAKVAAVNPGIFTAADYARKALRVARLHPSPPSLPTDSPTSSPGASRRGGGLARVRRRSRDRRIRIGLGVGAALFASVAVIAAVVRLRTR
jgi:hypothetical protein